MSIELGLFVAILMLIGNAFFVGAEFGLVSSRRSNIELAALNGSRAAKITLGAMEQVSLMLAGAQLGVTVCSLVLGAVGEPLIAHMLEEPLHQLGAPEGLLHPISFTIALVVTVYLHVVIGEMVPKNLALASPTKTALVLTPALVLFVRITRPLVASMSLVANIVLRIVGVTPKDELSSSFSRDEVAGFVKESHREGYISPDEEHLLSSALSLDEQRIKAVLMSIETVLTVPKLATPAEIESLSAETGYSRFPVASKKGKLVGYVHLKDVIGLEGNKHKEPIDPRTIRPLVTLKKSDSLRGVLKNMQEKSAHLAQITDNKGNTIGLVTLEDVLEELVGVIRDEARSQKPESAV